jgi:hypothetical protein
MMYVLKEGVSLAGLQIEMRPVMREAGRIWRDQGKQWLRITSGTDGSHGVASFHPYGYALDIELPPNPAQAVSDLREALGCNYDVVLEKDHVHIEYDP